MQSLVEIVGMILECLSLLYHKAKERAIKRSVDEGEV